MIKAQFIIVLIALLSISGFCFAKRAAPKDVQPVIDHGVKHLAPHVTPGYSKEHGYPTCPIGCVEAWSVKSGKLLWRVQVYEIKYDEKLEHDVQDDFISILQIKNGNLFVETEHGDKFIVNLKTHEVKKQ
jgi:hypothetical protein